jgi:hypothetical protein
MRFLAAFLLASVAVLMGMTASSALSAAGRTVPCSDIIDFTKFPYVGDRRPEYRYRQLLGLISVPPAFMRQVVPTGQKPWAYWHKQGLVIGATGITVTVTVPRSWRKRAAMTWGNGVRPVSSLTFEVCGGSPKIGHAYAGGFLLRSPSACVPLIFTVGRRTATVRFGVGQRCHP